MCNIVLYQQLWFDHLGKNDKRSLFIVRQARELIEIHRRGCPECRGLEARTNYNARQPRRLSHRMGKDVQP